MSWRPIGGPWKRNKKMGNHFTVAAGDTEVVKVLDFAPHITITVIPAGTALVEFTTSSEADIDADTATWHDWSLGTVSAKACTAIIESVTALRFGATSSDADFELVTNGWM